MELLRQTLGSWVILLVLQSTRLRRFLMVRKTTPTATLITLTNLATRLRRVRLLAALEEVKRLPVIQRRLLQRSPGELTRRLAASSRLDLKVPALLRPLDSKTSYSQHLS